MNKKNLVDFVAENTGITKKLALKTINTVIAGIKAGLEKDGKVALTGFGSFELKTKTARTGRNPATGEEIEIPEKTVPKFRPSKVMKEMVEDVQVPEKPVKVAAEEVVEVVEEDLADKEEDLNA